MNVDGECHCGRIAYEARVEPGRILLCHCDDCQKLTGSAFRANIEAAAETFRLLRGAPRIYVKTADSGARRTHAFCGDCGAPIYAAAAENPTTYSLRIGGLTQRHELGSPRLQIWTRRALSWSDDLAHIPTVSGQP